mgnify:CR=1 FL=1
MIIPENIEELATYVQSEGKTVFFSQQTGVETVVSSSPPYQRLRQEI